MADAYIGLMSGTSLDGVDGVLARFDEAGGLMVLAHATAALPASLRGELLELNSPDGRNELHRAALAANALARAYAEVVAQLLATGPTERAAIRAVGAHGQTVRHRPLEFDGVGYTVQLNNPALLAELTGLDVVAEFRVRDLAAGGQGAPLVPAFHRAMFSRSDEAVAVLNLGGIANFSLLPAAADQGTPVIGFDCGPANALMDHWCSQHLGQPFDAGGRWAASGTVHDALLASLLSDPYFSKAPPKSTGRDLFNPAWLAGHLAGCSAAPADVQATLAEFTVRAAAQALERFGPASRRLIVCGGGALNDHLMARLRALLPRLRVESSAAVGLAPLQVEAAAFAWLAQATITRQPGNLPSVTGARGPRLLGAIFPA